MDCLVDGEASTPVIVNATAPAAIISHMARTPAGADIKESASGFSTTYGVR